MNLQHRRHCVADNLKFPLSDSVIPGRRLERCAGRRTSSNAMRIPIAANPVIPRSR
jgi:hypothetical protein